MHKTMPVMLPINTILFILFSSFFHFRAGTISYSSLTACQDFSNELFKTQILYGRGHISQTCYFIIKFVSIYFTFFYVEEAKISHRNWHRVESNLKPKLAHSKVPSQHHQANPSGLHLFHYYRRIEFLI
jgi:hypothetical protein